MVNLFTFVRADLDGYRPKSQTAPGFEDGAFGDTAIAEPDFPKSLFLIRPLFAAYELNAVAENAQELVAIPEGLDLDAWIVPPPKEFLEVDELPEETVEPKKKKKSKKGKEKEVLGTQSKGKSRSHRETGDGAASAPRSPENEEERGARERVCSHYP